MAQVPKFDLLKPEAWEDFLEDFELYCDGKGVTDDAQKRGMLCGAIPAETLAKLKDRVKPDKIRDKPFDELTNVLRLMIKPTVNPLARFDDFVMRMQHPAETAQTYVSELGKLGKALDLGDLHDRLVLAQLVRGLRNRELQKELFSLADTLNLTVAMRKAELVETGEKCLERIENNRMGEVFTLKAGPSAGSENKGRGRRSDPPSCYRCAGPHLVADCKIDPRTLRCEICKRVGHSTKAHIGDRAPRTRRGKGKPEGLHRVEGQKSEEEQSEGEDVGEGLYHISFEDDTEAPAAPPPTTPSVPTPEPERGATPLNLAVFSAHLQQSQQQSEKEPNEPRCPPLLVSLLVSGVSLVFELDTGCERTVITEKTWQTKLPGPPMLRPCGARLHTWGAKTPLTALGRFHTEVPFRGKGFNVTVVVLSGEGPNLLGRNWLFQFLGREYLEHVLGAEAAVYAVRVEGESEEGAERNGSPRLVAEETTSTPTPHPAAAPPPTPTPTPPATPQLRIPMRPENLASWAALYPAVSGQGTGRFRGKPINIHLAADVPPRYQKARRIPFALQTKYLAAIEKNVQRGVWVPVDVNESGVPKWATALVPVPKKGGALRLCADYKGTVNRAVAADTYLTPTIDEVLAACQGGKFFGELDLAEAYTQVPLDMETSLALTVNSCKGLFRPTTLPFGVKIATAIFQRIMDGLFGGKDGIIPYLDNIYVVGADWKQYVGRLHQALTILSEAGFLVNAEKCTWGEQALDVLGFRVGQGGVMPQEVKVRAIKDAPAPANKQQLSSLLGLIAFYGRFIKNKASILEPLHRLLDDGKDFQWGEQEQAALDAVKRQVAAEPCLAHFDPKRAIFLSADASPWGVGALISHEFKDKETGKIVERPIAFASRTLSKPERNYAQVDREALSIIFGVKRFKMFLQGRPFTIRTDHKPLIFLFKAGAPSLEHISPRMLRWTLLLGSMDYKIEYRAGKDMGSADFLSRHPLPETEEESYVPGVHLLEAKDWSGITSTQIAEESAKDPTLRQVLRWTRDGWPKTVSDNFLPFYRKREALSILKGCLLWSDRVVIPPSLREDTLKLTHASHSGINFSKSTARAVAWWPNMDDEVELRVKRCAPCQSTANRPPRDLASTWPAARQVWERVHVDFAGPFEGHLYLITIDAFSKWPVIKVVANLTAECLITHMRYIFAEYGLPGLIVSDNGRQLVSKDFETFLRRNGVRHITSPPWHPSSNGLAERTVQSFKKLLRRFTEGDVHARVARALWAMRTRPSTTTGKSPAALLGRPLNGHLERLRPTDHPDDGAHKGNPWLGRQVWALRHKHNAKSEWISGLVTGVEGARVVVVEDIATRVQLRVSVDEVRDRPDGAPAPALPENQAGDTALEEDDDVTPVKRRGTANSPPHGGRNDDGPSDSSEPSPRSSASNRSATSSPLTSSPGSSTGFRGFSGSDSEARTPPGKGRGRGRPKGSVNQPLHRPGGTVTRSGRVVKAVIK